MLGGVVAVSLPLFLNLEAIAILAVTCVLVILVITAHNSANALLQQTGFSALMVAALTVFGLYLTKTIQLEA